MNRLASTCAIRLALVSAVCLLLTWSPDKTVGPPSVPVPDDWTSARHDAGNSLRSRDQVNPPLEVRWIYRASSDASEAVVIHDKLYVATLESLNINQASQDLMEIDVRSGRGRQV